MKKFLIKVNGNQYEVEVEEVRDGSAPVYVQTAAATIASAPPVQVTTPVQTAAPTAPAIENKQTTGGSVGGVKISAPMPGTILKIVASIGDTVKRGSVLVVLEAMKMENEIVAPSDGVVASINVNMGASVNAGDLLASLK
jgi:biotin carboxyl carrier protein